MEGSVTGSRRGQERASVRLALGRWKDVLGVGAYLLPPAIALALAAAVWELWVRIGGVAEYLVPAPSAILSDLFVDIEYFAFHGAYAESPAAVSPIGRQVRRLRELAPDFGAFMSLVSGVSSYAEFLDVLSEVEAAGQSD